MAKPLSLKARERNILMQPAYHTDVGRMVHAYQAMVAKNLGIKVSTAEVMRVAMKTLLEKHGIINPSMEES